MAFELEGFVGGDSDYIGKHNINKARIEAAITQLQTALGGGFNATASMGAFFTAITNGATTLIGTSSYTQEIDGTDLEIESGSAYKATTQSVVRSVSLATLAFSGLSAGTYYVNLDSLGIPTLSEEGEISADSIYSVVWSGSSFGDIEVLVKTLFDADEEDDSRVSIENDTEYETLQDRLEAIEESVSAAEASIADVVDDLEDLGAVKPIRKVGFAFDDTTGVDGRAIQIDFPGTIIGWSIIADAVGDIEIEVSVKNSSAPPSAPAIPDVVTDLITASAPIALSSAQSAASGTSGVSTWTTSVVQWDVIQFNVISVSGITKGTAYLRIQEV